MPPLCPEDKASVLHPLQHPRWAHGTPPQPHTSSGWGVSPHFGASLSPLVTTPVHGTGEDVEYQTPCETKTARLAESAHSGPAPQVVATLAGLLGGSLTEAAGRLPSSSRLSCHTNLHLATRVPVCFLPGTGPLKELVTSILLAHGGKLKHYLERTLSESLHHVGHCVWV